MSYACYVCRKLISGGIRGLFAHLRSLHFICEMPGVTLKCGQGDCIRCYSTFNSLLRHLRSEHPSPDASLCSSLDIEDDCDAGCLESGGQSTTSAETPQPGCSPLVPDTNTAAASFLASLLSSSSVTQKTVQTIVEHTTTLIADIVQDITSDVVGTVSSASPDVLSSSEYNGLLNRLQQRAKPFESLSTQHKRMSFFRTKYHMVEAKSMFLGNRYDQCLDPATGSMRQVIKRDTFQYVPILSLVALLLSDGSILQETLKERVSVDGVMRDFCDGMLYRSNALFAEDRSALQLCLYFDECEVVNPLGSRRGIHKIGFIYLSLRNVHAMYSSRLSNIHIVAAFSSIDRSKYGFDKILAPIVADIRQLEQGVDLPLRDGTVVHKRGTVVQIAGDNLGLNQLCGFVESFSATHFCRLCMTDKASCADTYSDDDLELRTADQYTQQLQGVLKGTLSTKDCGIKTSCPLNRLQYFHIIDNGAIDVMHDVAEGVVPYELKLMLSEFIFVKKYFSLELLNARLASFDYGYNDRRNKPTALSDNELRDPVKTTLNQKAAQTLCLAVILPFVVGDKVPENDDMWHLYLLLRDIIDLVFADTCTVGDSICLKYKIQDHHSLFRSVFPDRHLLPKHHMLVHYPQVMRKVGPLSRCSSMRFEAKHYESKRLCGIVCCFKDICKTVVKRHQLAQCVRLATGNCAAYELSVECVQVSTVNELPEADSILSSLPYLKRFDDISCAECVSICGTEYRPNMVLVVDVDDEPTFCKIVRCLVVTDHKVYFVCLDLNVKHYDSHLHAYSIEQKDSVRVVEHCRLNYYKPVCVRRTFHSTCDSEYIVFP